MFDLNEILAAKMRLIDPIDALPGRPQALDIDYCHHVLGNSFEIPPKLPELQYCLLGMGCFWGAERAFWQLDGVFSTAVGYAAGFTPNPSYEEVCSGRTGHTEVVLVIYDPSVISFADVLVTFFESHNPTQGMRQANDRGTQYRSGVYLIDDRNADAQLEEAKGLFANYQSKLQAEDLKLTSEILKLDTFYYAEQYHQQYLAKNPGGYCNLQTVEKTGLPRL